MADRLMVIPEDVDVVEVYGVKVHTGMFLWFAEEAKTGDTFRFSKNENGVVSIWRAEKDA